MDVVCAEPARSTTFSCERTQVSQPLMALTARQKSSKSALLVATWAMRCIRSRAGFCPYSSFAHHVAEPVVDVVHRHQRGGGLGVLHHRRGPTWVSASSSTAWRSWGLREAMARGHRHAPDLLQRQRARLQHRCRGSASGPWPRPGMASRSVSSACITGRLQLLGEGVLALLPVAGAELVGLEPVEDAQHLGDVAAHARGRSRWPSG